MNFNKMIIFAGLSFVLIMAYSSYFLFQENNLVENNAAKINAQQPELFSKTEETIVGKVIKSHVESDVDKVIHQQPELFSKIEETIVTKVNESQEESIKTAESSESTTNVEINKTGEKFFSEENKKENLYQPIYDNGIVRSTAKAFFLLQDARSKLLEPNIVVKVRIWRNIRNSLWLEEEATYNHQKSLIECEGVNRQGLEPGYYSVEVDGGGYGLLKFKFWLKKNEEFFSTYIMPNYSKVIAVQFVDRDGNNVEYTRSQPLYKWNPNVAPFSEYETQKYLVLKNPPSYGSRSGGGRKWSRTYGCGGPSDFVYQPENGRYYLRVFSGQEGQVSYEYRKNEGSKIPFFLESKFEDKLDSLEIQLDEPPLIKENTSVYIVSKSSNNEYVGYNANTIISESSIYEEKFDYSLKGFSFQLKDSKFPLQLEYKAGSDYRNNLKGDGYLFQKNLIYSQSVSEVMVRFIDKKIFKSSWEIISLEEGVVSFKEIKFNLKEFKVNISMTSTFFEMAKDFSMVTSEDRSFDLSSTIKNLCFTSLFNMDDKLLEENLSKLNLSIKSNISVENATNGTFNPSGYLSKKGIYEESLLLSANDIINNVNHEVEIAPIQKTLILRAINNSDSGMPWVEASLVASENLSKAIEIQKAFNEISNTMFLNSLAYIPINMDSEVLENNEIRDKLKTIFPKKEAFKYFCENGAWYNTSAKGISDSKGYLILKSDELIPGKKYTLFLWCQSQDEMKPDKEISFIAQKGITDLGAIKFE